MQSTHIFTNCQMMILYLFCCQKINYFQKRKKTSNSPLVVPNHNYSITLLFHDSQPDLKLHRLKIKSAQPGEPYCSIRQSGIKLQMLILV
jgi:hypothetical protein